MSKEELRKRIERDPQLKKDFDFLIAKTGLTPEQLLTGLRLDCKIIWSSQASPLNGQPWLNTTGCPLPQSLK